MPVYHHFDGFHPTILTRPHCKHCGSAMMLVQIDPASPGVDLHTFECAVCEHEFSAYAPYDFPHWSKGRVGQGDP